MKESENDAMPVAPSAPEVERALLGIRGVVHLYPAGSALSRAVDLGAAAWGAGELRSRVRVDDASATAQITVSLGVSAGRPVLETLGDVTEALAALYAEADRPEPILHLTVVHLDDRPLEVDPHG